MGSRHVFITSVSPLSFSFLSIFSISLFFPLLSPLFLFSMYQHSGSTGPLCDHEFVGLIPGRIKGKTVKIELAALLPGTQH